MKKEERAINWGHLRDFLRYAPITVKRIELSFKQIEVILRREVSSDHAARKYYPYFRNMNWLGWRVAHTYTSKGLIDRVIFERKELKVDG